jgi:hypothetical protein
MIIIIDNGYVQLKLVLGATFSKNILTQSMPISSLTLNLKGLSLKYLKLSFSDFLPASVLFNIKGMIAEEICGMFDLTYFNNSNQ